MKKSKILSLCLAAALAAGMAGCGGSASSAGSAASAASNVPDGDGDPTVLTVAMECAYAP